MVVKCFQNIPSYKLQLVGVVLIATVLIIFTFSKCESSSDDYKTISKSKEYIHAEIVITLITGTSITGFSTVWKIVQDNPKITSMTIDYMGNYTDSYGKEYVKKVFTKDYNPSDVSEIRKYASGFDYEENGAISENWEFIKSSDLWQKW